MSATAMLWIAGALIACAATALAAWALFADRARGRRRCPKCWYDMSGAPDAGGVDGDGSVGPLRCPECGREIKHARQLARTRRRWRWAFAAALLLLVATGCFITGKAKRDGWERITPTTVLILIALWSDDPWALEHVGFRVMRTLGTERSWKTPRPRLWKWQASWGLDVVMRQTFEMQARKTIIVSFEVIRDVQKAGRLEQNVSRDALEAFVRAGLQHTDHMARMWTIDFVWTLAPTDPLQDEAMAAALKGDDLVAGSLTMALADSAVESDVALQRLLTMMTRAESDIARRQALTRAAREDFRDTGARARVIAAIGFAAAHDPVPSTRKMAAQLLEDMNKAAGKPAR